jgi:hypothetical protein
MRRQQDRAAEALDLKGSLRLRLDALPQPIPAEQCERPDYREHDAGEGEKRARQVAPPHRDAEERQDRGRVDLRGEREPEEREGERRAFVEQRA